MLKTVNEQTVKNGIGVIVGRFQVSELHEGHIELFESVLQRHEKVICVLGLSAVKATKANPLNFVARCKMIEEKFPDIQCVYQKDQPSNESWSKQIDNLIGDHVPPESDVKLYGSRDSFIDSYLGRYPTVELVQKSFTSGTQNRKSNGINSGKSKEFREGVIWATENQYATAFSAVDVAIVNFDTNRILLGRKPHETKFRLVGGFVDPRTGGDGNFLEINARRETMEETGLVVEQLDYVDSFLVDDWRYRGEENKIFSTLFIGHYSSGRPSPNDDIVQLQWFDIPYDGMIECFSGLNKEDIVDEHHKLLDAVINKLNKQFKVKEVK